MTLHRFEARPIFLIDIGGISHNPMPQVFGLANKAEKNYVEAIKAFKFSLRLNSVCFRLNAHPLSLLFEKFHHGVLHAPYAFVFHEFESNRL